MPVQVIWDDEAKSTIRQIYSGHLVLGDYIAATDLVEQLAKEVPHTVHSIMDRLAVITAPGIVIPALRYANNHVPTNLGIRVVIKGDMFTRVLVDMGRRVAPRLVHDIYFVNTLEEARATIIRRAKPIYTY